MRFATLTDRERLFACVRAGDEWLEIPASGGSPAATLMAALDSPADALAEARPLGQVTGLRPTMPYRPWRDVFCLGKNYRAHAEEFSRFNGDRDVVPDAPVVFTKSVSAMCGPTDDLVVRSDVAGALDYEAELAVVIGQGGSCIDRAEALDHVAGYSIVNDTTARDLQKVHTQWYLGKSLPAATPWGPVIVTPDELEPFAERVISATVNGEQRQCAVLGQMIFTVADAIAGISRVVALQPGDLIAMGTPSGVGVGFDPSRFLVDLDVVTCAIEGIGELCNRVRVVQAAVTGEAGDTAALRGRA